MTDQNPAQPNPQQQTISLQHIAQGIMQGLQRHFDMLAYNIAARGAVTDEIYLSRVRAPKIMPLPQAHLNLEQLQAYSNELMTRQVLADAFNLCQAALNNCHLLCSLIDAKSRGEDQEQLNAAAQQAQQQFPQLPVHEKFNTMEEAFGITSPMEDTIISIAYALQILTQKNGMVSDAELDDSGELTFEFKVVEQDAPVVGQQATGRLVEKPKIFRKGDRVVFTADELQQIHIALAEFFQTLFRAVENFAKSKHGEQ